MIHATHNAPLFSIAILACMLLTGCDSENAKPVGDDSARSIPVTTGTVAPNESHVAKVKVLADGTILLDEKQVTIDELKAAFAKLKDKENGSVFYYRENADGEPPAQAMAVIQAVVEAGLPIKLSTKPDFSDSVGPN